MLNKKTNRIVLNIFSFLLLLTIFHNTSIPYLQDIGYYALLAMLLFSSILLMYIAVKDFKAFLADKKVIIICYAVITLFSLIGVIRNFNYNGISAFAECILLMNFFFAVSSLRFDKEYFDYNIIGVILAVIIAVMFIGLLNDETLHRSYFSIYDNSSAFGLRAFSFGCLSLVLYALSNKKYYLIITVLFLVLVVLSNTRTCILNSVLIVFALLLYKIISKNKISWYMILTLMFLFIAGISILYPILSKAEFADVLDKKVVNLTGKNFFSGRHRTWLASLEMAIKKPILGYGTGKKIYELVDMYRNDPTHSLYLQMFLENGIFSMLAICTLFVAIWKKFYTLRNNTVIKYCAIFTLAIMFQSIFEVTLLQGNMLVGVLQWLVLGIGISSLDKKNNSLQT